MVDQFYFMLILLQLIPSHSPKKCKHSSHVLWAQDFKLCVFVSQENAVNITILNDSSNSEGCDYLFAEKKGSTKEHLEMGKVCF